MTLSDDALPAWCNAFKTLITEIVAESEDSEGEEE